MLEEVTTEQQSLTTAIIDFVMTEEPCDIDILRRALYCQVKLFISISLSMSRSFKNEIFKTCFTCRCKGQRLERMATT